MLDVHLSGPEEKGVTLSAPINRSLTNNVKHLLHIWAHMEMEDRQHNVLVIKADLLAM